MLVQRQAPSLRPLTTAHLAQTMTLLELTADELRQRVEAALASNPALELIDALRCPSCRRPLPGNTPCPFCSRPNQIVSDQAIVFVSPCDDFYSPSGSARRPDEDVFPEEAYETASSVEELPQYILRQIAPELAPADRPLAAHILTNLDEDGLLTVPLAEIAKYHHITLARVQAVQRLIQRAEPVGVASLSPREALLVQIEVLAESQEVPPLAAQAVEKGIDLLSRHRYPELGRLLGISTEQAREIARFIRQNLNPFPGRAHWGDAASGRSMGGQGAGDPRPFGTPDVIISRLSPDENSPLVVEVALPLGGMLRVNPLFREALQQAPAEKVEGWQADLEQATLLVKCIQQRNHTMVRLMQRLSTLQRAFILYGEAYLQPLTRATLAQELEVHESTISRAVSGKAVQLPNGRIVPLSMFFDRSLHIRSALKKIVAQEIEPLSDTEIGAMLAKQGYPIARRTVAKYRAMEGILPAHLRHPAFSTPAYESRIAFYRE